LLQVRESEGKETEVFLEILNRRNPVCVLKEDAPKPFVFQVKKKGKRPTSVLAIQLEKPALNSSSPFLVQTDSTTFVWNGKGSNASERDFALRVASKIQVSVLPK
jgi:hypothetical protein